MYNPRGELLPVPYTWTPEAGIEGLGFIDGGSSHFLFNTNGQAGPSVFERGVYQAP